MRRQDLRKALHLYDEALRRGYAPFWVHYNRGALLILLNDFARAKADLLEAKRLDPKHPGPDLYLSQIR